MAAEQERPLRSGPDAPCTVAVVVSHRPDMGLLQTALRALCAQVDGLVLVDNGSGEEAQAQLRSLLQESVQAIPKQSLLLPENTGLGYAQNAGIALARDRMGADCVLLMDQDSAPAPGMVAGLRVALKACDAAGGRAGAIGADFSEPQRGRATALPKGQGRVVEREAVISSGALIPLKVWERVGPFDEGLFIDFVDTEWCFRARAAGYRCYAARGAGMEHRIGAPGPSLGGRRMAVHTPERMYYQLRNLLLLARRPAVPRGWLLRTLPRYLGRSIVLALMVRPRRRRAGAVARGLWHGLQGRSGGLGA